MCTGGIFDISLPFGGADSDHGVQNAMAPGLVYALFELDPIYCLYDLLYLIRLPVNDFQKNPL